MRRIQRLKWTMLIATWLGCPVFLDAQALGSAQSKSTTPGLSGKNVTVFSVSEDRHSTADKKIVLQEIRGELPLVVCNSNPAMAAAINNYLFESLVAEELDGVYGDDDPISEELAVNDGVAETATSDSGVVSASELWIFGELDFYGTVGGKTLLGITVFYESSHATDVEHKNPLYSERNHFLFDANTGAPIGFEQLAKLLNIPINGLQETIANSYSIAVEEALKQPCLIENTDMAGLLKLNQHLRKTDFQADEFVRSIPVYLQNGAIIFDRPILPDAYKACDPMGVIIPLKR